MRLMKKSEVREIKIGHVEFTLIFLFHDFLCKITILELLKVRFLDKKQKLLSDDGTSISEIERLESCYNVACCFAKNMVLCKMFVCKINRYLLSILKA